MSSTATGQPGDRTNSGGRTLPRSALPARRASAAPLPKIGMAVFTLGVLAVAVDVILFASGSHDLPLWINLLAMLAPVGLGIGLLGVFREARDGSPALVERRAAEQAAAGAAPTSTR